MAQLLPNVSCCAKLNRKSSEWNHLFDFTLSDDDMKEIAGLDTSKSLFFDHHDPEVVKMFMGWR